MAKKLDIILLGITGFTGWHTVPFLKKFCESKGRNLTWGVAGRSQSKIQECLDKVAKLNDLDLSTVPVILADINNYDSLVEMAKKCRLVVNCCGPYRLLGDAVVKACIESGTHHVDVSGEAQYMERVQLEQHLNAEEKGVYVVSSCGFDSILYDLGVIYLQDKFKGTLNSVETFLEIWWEGNALSSRPQINIGTWKSAVHAMANFHELKELHSKLFPARLSTFQPKLSFNYFPRKVDEVEGWVVPFLGPDKYVVKRTQKFFFEADSKRPVQMEAYMVIKSLWNLIIMSLLAGIVLVLTQFSLGANLLLKYPNLFSLGLANFDSPKEEDINRCCFRLTLLGKGWKDKQLSGQDEYKTPCDSFIVGQVQGRNPGYGATCIALVLTGVKILTETDKLPGKGGVFPPGAAFAKTSLLEELHENGVTFEIKSQGDL